MKKIHFISMMALAVMVLCSCSNKDYQKAIPANATLVVKMDVRSISDKAEFKESKYKMMLDGLLATAVKGEDMKTVKKYVDDPQKMGFDLSTPLYFFMVGEETVGLTLKTGDEGDLNDFLQVLNKQGLASKPTEKDGLKCGTLMDEITYTYDANTFLLLASLKGREGVSNQARELMTLKESDSFASTEAFDRMNDDDNDVATYLNGDVFGQDVLKELKSMMSSNSLDPRDMDAVMTLNFENGQATFKAKVWGKNEKAQTLIDEAYDSFDNIEGKYIDRVSNDMLMWMGMNVKGEWLLNKMKENQSTKEALFVVERAIDIEQMLRAVDGDLAFELQMEDVMSKKEPEYIVYGTLKNSDFLADVEDWKNTMKDYDMTMEEKGKNQYVLTMDDASYKWGVQDNDIYFSSLNAVTKNEGKSPLADNKDDIKKNKVYLYINLARIPWGEFFSKSEMNTLQEPLDKLQALVIKGALSGEVTLAVELKDKNENFLKQLLK